MAAFCSLSRKDRPPLDLDPFAGESDLSSVDDAEVEEFDYGQVGFSAEEEVVVKERPKIRTRPPDRVRNSFPCQDEADADVERFSSLAELQPGPDGHLPTWPKALPSLALLLFLLLDPQRSTRSFISTTPENAWKE